MQNLNQQMTILLNNVEEKIKEDTPPFLIFQDEYPLLTPLYSEVFEMARSVYLTPDNVHTVSLETVIKNTVRYHEEWMIQYCLQHSDFEIKQFNDSLKTWLKQYDKENMIDTLLNKKRLHHSLNTMKENQTIEQPKI